MVSSEAPSGGKAVCLSMDGLHHDDGESWHDGCRDCYCHGDREMCSLISCPVPECENPTIQPGQCCPTCPGNYFPPPIPLYIYIYIYIYIYTHIYCLCDCFRDRTTITYVNHYVIKINMCSGLRVLGKRGPCYPHGYDPCQL